MAPLRAGGTGATGLLLRDSVTSTRTSAMRCAIAVSWHAEGIMQLPFWKEVRKPGNSN